MHSQTYSIQSGTKKEPFPHPILDTLGPIRDPCEEKTSLDNFSSTEILVRLKAFFWFDAINISLKYAFYVDMDSYIPSCAKFRTMRLRTQTMSKEAKRCVQATIRYNSKFCVKYRE